MTTNSTALPTYDPASIAPGIAHFGVGNFHRSHQAMYLNRLMELGLGSNWGIVGIGVMPGDIAMRDALASQNFRYTLIEKHNDGSQRAQEIRSIRDFLYAPEDPEAVLDQLAAPEIRIVSLTITEGGYNIDRATGEFDLSNPMIQFDLQTPHHPTTVFGFITEALRRRRLAGTTAFTVMSCDNLPGNGDVTKSAILAFANATDPDLATWIEANVCFPNSMVDRITPVTTEADRAMVKERYGIDDAWPVVTEPFVQWVLEDHFSDGRPEYETVGVQIVEDVAPYELVKLRLLNASHQAMAYAGMLRGHTYVHEAVADPEIEQFLRAYLAEARQTLRPVKGLDIDEYIESLFERYQNSYIADTLARLAVDASDRIPKFVLPAIRENLAAGRDVTNGVTVIAQWRQWVATSEKITDLLTTELVEVATSSDPLAFVQYRPVFGDLAENFQFRNTFLSLREENR